MLNVFTCDIPADAAFAGHGHREIHLLVIAAGELQDRECSGAPRRMGQGSVRLSPAHAEHQLEFGAAGARCTIIEAAGPYWSRLFARGLRGTGSTYLASSDSCLSALAVGNFEELLQHPDSVRELGRLLARLEHGESFKAPAWAEDAMMELDGNRDCAVSRIANAVDRNRAHFSRGFSKCFGLRPSEYRSLKKVLRALEDVAGGHEPLSSIALAHGYSDQSHMTHAFRAILGRSPSSARAVVAG